MAGIKSTKTLASGSQGSYVVDARYAFQRETNLPLGWKKVRLAAIFSWVGLGGDNDDPIAELLGNSGAGLDMEFVFGLSNGVSVPGKTGNKFIGMGCGSRTTTPAVGYYSTGSTWRYGSSVDGSSTLSMSGIAGEGTTIRVGSTQSIVLETGIPSATTAFSVGVGLELDCTTDGTLTARYINSAKRSTATEPDLMGLLTASSSTLGSPSGNWWNGATPTGCTHFYMRWPFVSSRLRLHNYGYLQLA